MTIANLSLDHYPYHEFGSSKKHWIKYNEIQSLNRDDWAAKLHQQWHEQFNIAKASVPNDEMCKYQTPKRNPTKFCMNYPQLENSKTLYVQIVFVYLNHVVS